MTTKSRRTHRKSTGAFTEIKKRTAALSRRIDTYLKTLKSGGGRLQAWQDKYPVAGTTPWVPSNNICQNPTLAAKALGPPFMNGGRRSRRRSHARRHRSHRRGGGYGSSETYFGRRPVGYTGPLVAPFPNTKSWTGAGRRRSRRSRR